MNKGKTFNLIMIALFAAFTAVCTQISVPLPLTPVPVNLALFSVFMSGYILGTVKGAASQLLYVLLGCVGVPVFSNFQSGIGMLVGPTGGYIIGYIIASLITGLLNKGKHSVLLVGISMSLGLVACYSFGTLWFIALTHTRVPDALWMCVIPFLPGDTLKIILATSLSKRLNNLHKK